jgi:sugar lactone lactonase YvrE
MRRGPTAVGCVREEVGESPLWDAARSALLWVDLLVGELHAINAAGGDTVLAVLDEPLGFVVPLAGGGLVAGTRSGVGLIDRDGRFELKLAIEPDRPSFRINDGKCDPRGRLWLGTMSDEDPVDGRLYRIDPGWRIGHVRTDLRLPNGMAWDRAGSTMWLADSAAGRIEVWDYDLDEGSPIRCRTVIDLSSERGQPDGMAIDTDGCVWVALWGGGAVRRYAPDGRRLDERQMPAPLVASCAFGGESLSDLYVTSARYRMSPDELSQHPRSGSLFRLQVGCQGLPADEYRP